MIANSAAYGLAMLIMWLSRSSAVFVLSGAVSGFLAGGTLVFNSYVIDIVPEEEKGSRLGIFAGVGIGMAFGVGIPVGSAVDSVIGETTFLICAIGCFVTAAVSAVFLPETLREPTYVVDWAYANPFGVFSAFWKRRALAISMLIIVTQTIGFAAFQSQIVNYARWRWKFAEATSGAVIGLIGISVAVTAPVMFRLCQTSQRTLEVTTAIFVVGLMLAGFASHDMLFLIVLAVIMLALAQPSLPALSAYMSSLASESDQADMQANLSVINNGVSILGIYAATAIFVDSVHCEIYAGSMMLVAGAVVGAGLVAFSVAVRSIHVEQAEATQQSEDGEYYINQDAL